MARSGDQGARRGFSRSGHTSHPARPDEPSSHPTTPYGRPSEHPPWQGRPAPPAPPPSYRRDHPQARTEPVGGYSRVTRHGAAAQRPGTARGPTATATRAVLVGTSRAARFVTTRVINASKADGADQSGLTALIWNQVLSYGTDAMITVALAGTVFFGASPHAQRGNVLMYLLVTMAPFAVVAPVIGPVLDRWQHGRRWAMAATAFGRAILALIMAAHPSELLVLYPCALGSLVLSKAYAVLRASAAPRLVPPGMTLTQANARLTIFGFGSTLVLGAAIGALIKASGSYSLGLWITAVAFGVCGFFALRLPRHIDSSVEADRHPQEPSRPRAQQRVPPLARLRRWATRGFAPNLVIALQGESALRLLSGLLTIYLAFWVESSVHGVDAAWQLGAIVAAAGVGNFTGTAIGTRLRMARPEAIIVVSVAVAAGVCTLVGILFGVLFAVVGMYVAAATNALSKIALDALIQRDVRETNRSSAFARSETFLQLAWVVGAAIGVVLPSTGSVGGAVGFWTAAVIMGGVAIVVALRQRVTDRNLPRTGSARAPGTLAAGVAPARTPPPLGQELRP